MTTRILVDPLELGRRFDRSARIDAFWADYFGLRPADIGAPGTTVVTHAALAGYDGALVFRRGEGCIVSVPHTTFRSERAGLRNATPDEVFDPAFLARVFLIDPGRVGEEAWVGVADRAAFAPVGGPVRMLDDGDDEALHGLADACGERAWVGSRLEVTPLPMFGRFAAGADLAAVATYRILGPLAYLGVITHPRHRTRGYGREAAAAAMDHAFGRGLVPMWRTAMSNSTALRLGRSLGFRRYASTREVQLVATEF